MSSNLIALQNKFLGHGTTVYDKLAQIAEAKGHITDDDIGTLAREFNLPPQHVRATAKFYEELRHDKPANHVVKVCNGEACKCAGGQTRERALMAQLGVSRMGETSSKGVRLEHVTCLGLCGLGPNAMVDGTPVSLAGADSVETVSTSLRKGSAVPLAEPTNATYLPAAGKPRIVMRNFDKRVTALADARAAGVYSALERAVRSGNRAKLIADVKESGLRGRGGAGFPAGTKLETVANAPVLAEPPHGLASGSVARTRDGESAADQPAIDVPQERRYVVVNADEGDAGAYIDKEIMERDPHSLIEGALLAAWAANACEVIFYIRFEYPRALRIMRAALEEAHAAGMWGSRVLGSDWSVHARIVKGQGAYICGEETSLLRSIEGVPAIVSFKPPFPAMQGLYGCPTAVFNVETLHNFPWIATKGGAEYAKLGFGRSRGTKGVSINSKVKRPGMYEVELGMTLREFIFDLCGGMADGLEFGAVQVGGPLGGIFPERLLDTRLDFEDMGRAKGLLGHAGVVVYSKDDDLLDIGRGLMEFCAVESCGKCFPCRIGAVRGAELMGQMMEAGVTDKRLSLLGELCETMKYGSLCALGGAIPTPIENLMEYFPEVFASRRK